MATYQVFVDWAADGTFTAARDEVTARVLDGRAPVTMRYGRDTQRVLSPIAAGEAHFALNNISRDYSPENTASPLAGQVVPARAVLITGTSGSTTTNLFRGQLDDFAVQPSFDERYITVDCIDALGALRGIQVSTGLWQGLRPGEAIALILDAAGWPAGLRDLDTGATVMPFWWLDRADAFDAIMALVASEGPPALVTVDSQGRIVFRGRHHRLQNTASTTVQSTWRSAGAEPLIGSPTEYNHGWKEIVNQVSFDVPVRGVSGYATAVWTSQGQITVANGDTVLITASSGDPFVGAQVPAAGVDYTLVAGNPAITLSRTSGASVTIFITAVGSNVVIADLQLQAFPVVTTTTVQVVATDGASVAKYGARSLPDSRDPVWAGLGDARAIAEVILSQRAERLPSISVGMVSANATRLTQQLTRNLSDRVRIVETHTGLDADCFVEQISHTITQGGAEHRTVFGCEKAPAQITGAFILGSATAGVLGTNKLGRRGFTDPSRMFVLGSGVLGTNILVP